MMVAYNENPLHLDLKLSVRYFRSIMQIFVNKQQGNGHIFFYFRSSCVVLTMTEIWIELLYQAMHGGQYMVVVLSNQRVGNNNQT